MVSLLLFSSSIFLGSIVNAWSNPQKFSFDPSSAPGPLQECSQGVPRMTGPIPFPEDTSLNDDNIGFWVERFIECLWGNYFNNVKHIDFETLKKNILASDHEACYVKMDGSETCLDGEDNRRRLVMIRDVLDVNEMVVAVIEVNRRRVKIASNASVVLKVQIGSFQIGHAFEDYLVETFVFNDDGTTRKSITWTEDDLSFDLMQWAEQTLSGFGDYLKVDHANKHNYYQIDLGDTGVRVFIAFIIFWLVVAPIGMIWMMRELCTRQRVNKYEKVDVVPDVES